MSTVIPLRKFANLYKNAINSQQSAYTTIQNSPVLNLYSTCCRMFITQPTSIKNSKCELSTFVPLGSAFWYELESDDELPANSRRAHLMARNQPHATVVNGTINLDTCKFQNVYMYMHSVSKPCHSAPFNF